MNDEAILLGSSNSNRKFEEPSLGVFLIHLMDGYIPVNLFEAGDLTFKIYDLAEKEVYNKTSHFDAGHCYSILKDCISVDQNDIHLGDQQIII